MCEGDVIGGGDGVSGGDHWNDGEVVMVVGEVGWGVVVVMVIMVEVLVSAVATVVIVEFISRRQQ